MQLENDENFHDAVGRRYNIIWQGDLYNQYRTAGITFNDPLAVSSVLGNTTDDQWMTGGANLGPLLLLVRPPLQQRGKTAVPLPNPAIDGGSLKLIHERTQKNVSLVYTDVHKNRLRDKSGIIFARRFAVDMTY